MHQKGVYTYPFPLQIHPITNHVTLGTLSATAPRCYSLARILNPSLVLFNIATCELDEFAYGYNQRSFEER